jgi:anti-anti-sigma factor
VRLLADATSPPGYAATLEVCGEHDLASADTIRGALALIDGSVLVDLSECAFIDSTVIGVLLEDRRQRTARHHRLDLVVPPSNGRITRILGVAGLAPLLSIVPERP